MMRLVFALAAVAALCVFAASVGGRQSFDGSLSAHKLAGVVLIDDRGRAYRFAGVPVRGAVVMLGYTRCRDQCPASLARVTAAVARLPSQDRPRLIFLTIDPRHDSPVELRRFVSMWDPRVIGLTGDPIAVERAVNSLGSPMPPESEPAVHDARVSFVARDGEVRATLGPESDDAVVTAALRSIRPVP